MKLAVIYYSKTGQTKEMAEIIVAGMEKAGCEGRLFSVEEPVDAVYLKESTGIVFGSPTYMATSH